MTETAQPTHACTTLDAIQSLLTSTRLLVEPTQRVVFDTLPAEVRHVAGFHLGWWDADGGNKPAGGGKAIRPVMTLTCARAAGGPAHAAISAAVAVELVHDFSLLHDDIMDSDPTRRHRPAAWAAFGVPRALLTGDALLVSALQLVNSGTAGEVLRAAVLELCAGQAHDLAFEHRVDVRLPECLRMAEQKTGALFGAACELGALSVTDDLPVAGWYRQFGRQLGIAFQLIDDVLGIWGCESVTGKPVYSDLRSRKKSLPVVAALTSGTAAGRELAALYARADALTEDELSDAAGLVESAGGRAWAEAEAARRRHHALDVLGTANPDPSAANDLRALADSITTRVR
ncbi:(2E,6E)-farnesyl diphosphate synthase [Mycobacterium simulans]|uniref:polyprenyl synthetase family protein n=1 Tax=Mycobacterium simulans TaxID=627089 RepID=UPI00174A0E6F|nr:polyprenyl synthetase family protein [Mycobacterium simulans]SON59931.1 (2E,6E)-farnesyl diphosphate synthase [Mycobacterium simulans]